MHRSLSTFFCFRVSHSQKHINNGLMLEEGIVSRVSFVFDNRFGKRSIEIPSKWASDKR
jgi:hypothetical protein